MATVSNNPKFVTIVTGDNKKFPMSLKAVEKCRVIRRMFEHTDINEENEVPFDRLKAITMEKLIDWLVHHEDDPKADEAEKKDNADVLIPEWDKKFLAQFDQSALFDLIMAANYLDIPNLLEMCCKTVAGMIMGKTVEEIRRTFGIKNDFTPAEEEQIRLENAWCEE